MKNVAHIALLCVGGAITYGVLHDQVTAHLCVEYFTVGHVNLFPSRDPTWLALAWGIIATWWAGLLLGVPLGLLAQVGSQPKLTARHVVRPVLTIMLASGVFAILAGIVGYSLASTGLIGLPEPLASRVPQEKHLLYLADVWAHGAAYASGTVGGVAVWIWTWRKRGRVDKGQQSGSIIPPKGVEAAALRVLPLVGGLGLLLVALFAGLLTMLAGAGL